LALRINGIDISDLRVGEIVDVPDRSARILLDEEWAERVTESLRTEGKSVVATLN